MASFIRSDLDFILDQIKIAEANAAGTPLVELLPNPEVAFGLRTVSGIDNNVITGQETFGNADIIFPRLLDPQFNPAEAGTSYQQTNGLVIDSQPRTISNLIVDQTGHNPAAVAAAADTPGSDVVTGTRTDGSTFQTFFIPNVSPDVGLSAPFNAWMTFFGQFFDHGLDLVNKGGNGTVFIPLKADDPLFVPGSPTNFMVLTRATMLPGNDGILGTADDIHENVNQTSPFVDQNQTYTSHPSHQVFLRAYEIDASGKPVATGKLITNRDLGADGKFGTADDVEIGGMATWKVVKAQARDILGIQLDDKDALDLPLLATDDYGNFIRGANGLPQLATLGGLVEGNRLAPVDASLAIRTGHPFLADIAHDAAPVFDAAGNLRPDADTLIGNPQAVDAAGNNLTYDDELLDAHYIAGDGRVNENIALTTVHHIFHSEHNRQVDEIKATIMATGDAAFIAEWHLPDGSWNGERLFQAAKVATEMQYQHLVFEEFARTIQPNVDAFIDYNNTIDPAIVAEFAHTVYRFGHSMLTETVERLDPNFASSEIGLIQAFLNPLAFADSGPTPEQAAGAIVRGTTRQVGNEIDEFVTEALRNNLLGLPLDLPAINMARARDAGIPSLNAARRTFFDGTGDSQLTPYTNWVDFSQHLKHPESLINFIAAYGTHSTITSATTLAAKRAAAADLVLGGAGAPADRLDFLYGTGAWADSGPHAKDLDGVTTTGLGSIDFWVGGLAEAKMPFGGMLGSTFNFVFETQLENLQNGDRLYYLHRFEGKAFLQELEDNSFAELIMNNTDVTHLPALSFSAVAFTLETDITKQFGADPVSGNPFFPLVIRGDHLLQYTGEDHVVLGGTAADDRIVSGDGDDTLWGDQGNDRLEGGYGNDQIHGGAGDDILTDAGGDDTMHGEEGNDVIHGGSAIAVGNLLIGGPGSDFIISGEDFSDERGGTGDDFILGARLDVFPHGNEGDDWLERGLQDGAAGDDFDPFGQDPIPGNDVFLGDGGFDEVIGEGGDDIVVGSEGGDKYDGMSGYDWVTYKDAGSGVHSDYYLGAVRATATVAPPVPASVAGLASLAFVEGLSGSQFADVLRGEDSEAIDIAAAGARGSALTNPDLITGLRAFLGTAFVGGKFDGGNIILGGSGSDIIEGRGGNDLIDGDRWLNVRVSVRANADGTGAEIASFDHIADIAPFMLDGTYNPGQLVIQRELLSGTADFDTAVFTGNRADYTVTTVAGVTTVTQVNPVAGAAADDGTDRLTNIERLQFNDQVQVLVGGLNANPTGNLSVSDTTPAVGQTLTASLGNIADADGLGDRVTYTWQQETAAGSGVFKDYSGPNALLPIAFGNTFTVTEDLAGLELRVKGTYVDGHGVQEMVFSNATAAVGAGTPQAPVTLLNAPQTGIVSPGIHLIGSDLQFILNQIKIAERHAAGEDLIDLVDNLRSPQGLRTVDGSFNNLTQSQSEFGASDNVFPRLTTPEFRPAEAGTSYTQTSGIVIDSQPRTISNLVVDMTANNPAAIAAAVELADLAPADAAAVDAASSLRHSTALAAESAQTTEQAALAALGTAQTNLGNAQTAAANAQAAETAAVANLVTAQTDLADAQTTAVNAQAAETQALADLATAQSDVSNAQTAATNAQAAETQALAGLAATQANLANAQTAATNAQLAEDAALATLATAQNNLAIAQNTLANGQAAVDAALAGLAAAQTNAANATNASNLADQAELDAQAALATAQTNAANATGASNLADQAVLDAQAAAATAQANATNATNASNVADQAVLDAQAALGTAQTNLSNAQGAAADAQLAEDSAVAALATAQADVANAQTAASNAQNAETAAIDASALADQAALDAQLTLDILNGAAGDPAAAATAAANAAAAAKVAAQAALDAALIAGDPAAIGDATASRDAAVTADASAAAALAAVQADPTTAGPAVQDAVSAASASASLAQASELTGTAVSNQADSTLSAAQTALGQAQADAAAATAASSAADQAVLDAQAALDTAQTNLASAQTAAADAQAAETQALADLAAAQTNLADSQTAAANAQLGEDSALAALGAAQADLATSQTAAADAQLAEDAALAALSTAQNNVSVAQDALANGQAAVDAALADVAAAQANATSATAASNLADQAALDAQAAAGTAQTSADSATAASNLADQAVLDAQLAVGTAQANADTATAASNLADHAVLDAQATLGTAQATADSASAASNLADAQLVIAQDALTTTQTDATNATNASNAADAAAASASSALDTLLSTLGLTNSLGDLHITNTAPDLGLSAPFNAWMTFFGQFFDHGLDLVNKGGNGIVFMPLQPDDPLFVPGSPTNFMVLTRATMLPGNDGILGTADDIHENVNQTTPFVDQNQTYSSHPSQQVFLRAYEINSLGKPVDTGKLIVNRNLGPDGKFGTSDDTVIGGMATWQVVKAQARDILGLNLTDAQLFNVPLLATDPYGNFIRGAHGLPQVVMKTAGADGVLGTADDGTTLVEGNRAAPIDLTNAVGTNHQFLNDIAHDADPSAAPGLVRDNNGVIGGPQAPGTYDGELLDAHYIAGDGRVNENIGLTTVHQLFHSEHNRLVDHIKDVIMDTGDDAFIAEWHLADGSWNGERLFQAAKFGTEMQYQHLVFEEFARTIQPNIDVIIPQLQNYQSEINPAIVAEFAHTVYRFGHSMLTETIDRLDPDYNSSEIGLIQAFLNPLEFAASGPTPEAAAGAIIRGTTRQVGNEIDEFVTEALRNNLLGLPLDLPAINMARARDAGIPSLNAARAQFYHDSGDSNLTPYTSWADFVQHLKHPESLINFIAAYGTHSTITSATTVADKRAAATLIVLGGAGEPADRLDFLNGTGAWANSGAHAKDADGVTTTGLGSIDFWIGGLAEEITPFGGMLGSSFNFVFENQLEKLQNGDRMYYLERTADLNFRTELENNSFAKLIMANTDATHLPALVFKVSLILETDQTHQFNALLGSADPTGPNPLVPLVMRDDPLTPGLDSHYLRYTGEEHVVLGGTPGNDHLISSIGDDTLYGDEGNDRLDGGDGNDMIRAGAGDDIVTDTGGDDNIQGDDGNDVIHGGNGANLILGGFGKDFIIDGKDATESFGGPGDDFILGADTTEQDMGNEGDDWLENGLLDGAPGDNFNNRFADDIIGNDVFVGGGGPDVMFGEGGDDIMVGSSSGAAFNGDKFRGGSGYDWATFKDETAGVGIDMTLRPVVAPAVPIALDVAARFDLMEGLSGSSHSDMLRGDDADAALLPLAGARGSVLTNPDLIAGLRGFLGTAFVGGKFDGGNILLGGDGSDIIEGRGGDDLIDGDKWLNVRISVHQNLDGTGPQIASFDHMADMEQLMVDGVYNPGQLVIQREILPGNGAPSFDTVWYSGLSTDYIVNTVGGVTTVTDARANPTDGTDRLTGIERIQFSDQALVLSGTDNAPRGTVRMSDFAPRIGETLTVSSLGITDADNVSATNPTGAVTSPIIYFWQWDAAGDGTFEDINFDAGLGQQNIVGDTWTVAPAVGEILLAGTAIRVRGIYEDANHVLETVFSAPTALVRAAAPGNAAPVGTVLISDTTPTVGQPLTATSAFADANGIASPLAFQWQRVDSAIATDIIGATSATYLPTAADEFQMLRVVVTYTDGAGNVEQVLSMPTIPVGPLIFGTAGDDILTGTPLDDGIDSLAGNDQLFGLGGDDTLLGGAGNDLLDGGTGADSMSGGTGNDRYVVDNAGDAVNELPGEGTDTVQSLLAAYTLGANVENLRYDGATGNFTGTGNELANVISIAFSAGNHTLSGLGGDDTLNGGAGNDTLNGGEGNDVINGGAGADTMAGGAGNDRYTVDNAGDLVLENAAEGTDTVQTTRAAYTLGANVENLAFTGAGSFSGTGNALANVITGGTGNDSLSGAAGDDTLNGGAGNDTLNGGADNDVLNGGTGNDSMSGGAGNDRYLVDAAGDAVIEAAGQGSDSVETTLNAYTLGANVENLVFTGAGNFTGNGNALANVLTGAAGNDRLDGAAGNDTLNGGAGNDTIIGGSGADTLVGGAGDDLYSVDNGGDVVIEGVNQGTDAVQTTLNAYTLNGNVENLFFVGAGNFAGTGNAVDNILFGGAGNDTLSGAAGNDRLDGGAGNDNLIGGAGNDSLVGGAGADRLEGGAGNDIMNGGADNDVFVFAARGFGNDIIQPGFDANPAGGQDLLDISGLGIRTSTFNANVTISGTIDALITIAGAGTILLQGVAANAINQNDFILAP